MKKQELRGREERKAKDRMGAYEEKREDLAGGN
jgi:hypothetical protein